MRASAGRAGEESFSKSSLSLSLSLGALRRHRLSRWSLRCAQHGRDLGGESPPVKANKGSAGVDGRTVQDTAEYLKTAWPDIRRGLLDGTYRPEPVRHFQGQAERGQHRSILVVFTPISFRKPELDRAHVEAPFGRGTQQIIGQVEPTIVIVSSRKDAARSACRNAARQRGRRELQRPTGGSPRP